MDCDSDLGARHTQMPNLLLDVHAAATTVQAKEIILGVNCSPRDKFP